MTQSFLWFLQQLEAPKESFSHVCFVVREPQIRLFDFVSGVLDKKTKHTLVMSSITEELEASTYDQTAQLGLFGAGEALGIAHVAWLQDFLVPTESAGFLTQAQKNAECSKLLTVLQKNPNKTYFFEVPVKDFEGAKAFFDELSSCVFIKLPDALTLDEFAKIADLLSFSSSIPLEDLFAMRLEMPLDHALVLFEHASCVSKRTWEAFKEYSFGLLSSNSQLRDLSESFWVRNTKRFFAEWRRISPEYPEAFWVAYWSTQLWLAYFYIQKAQQVAKIAPTGLEHGLSPSFTWKNGWKKYSREYCEQLHSKLYEVDLELKNGSNGEVLEYFFNQQFLGDKAISRSQLKIFSSFFTQN